MPPLPAVAPASTHLLLKQTQKQKAERRKKNAECRKKAESRKSKAGAEGEAEAEGDDAENVAAQGLSQVQGPYPAQAVIEWHWVCRPVES